MSIRLWQGGLSFFIARGEKFPLSGSVFFGKGGFVPQTVAAALNSVERYGKIADYSSVSIYLDTFSSVFVPGKVAETCDPESLLAVAGIEPDPSLEAVITGPVEDVCAAVQLPLGVAEECQIRGGEGMRFLSPLHESMVAYRRSGAEGSCFVVYPTLENVYLTHYSGSRELLLAEVYPCHSPAEMVYYLNELAVEKGLNCREARVYIYGDRPERYTVTLKRYFSGSRTLTAV